MFICIIELFFDFFILDNLMLEFLCLPKEMISNLYLFAKLEKKSKNLSSLFRTIVPFFLMLQIISDLALAISNKVLKFLACA